MQQKLIYLLYQGTEEQTFVVTTRTFDYWCITASCTSSKREHHTQLNCERAQFLLCVTQLRYPAASAIGWEQQGYCQLRS